MVRSRFWGAIGLGAALVPAMAQAHPHVWIDMRSGVSFSADGKIDGMNIEWSFDDGYTQAALEGLDVNADGDYSADELAPLTKENIESLKEYEYFTVMRRDGEKLPIGDVTEYGQRWNNNKLSLHFKVPLKEPLDPHGGTFIAKVYDPDFFIAIDYVKDDPVSVDGPMPAGCSMEVKPVPTDEELDQTREMLSTKSQDWKPENNEDFGALFAQPVIVSCKP